MGSGGAYIFEKILPTNVVELQEDIKFLRPKKLNKDDPFFHEKSQKLCIRGDPHFIRCLGGGESN